MCPAIDNPASCKIRAVICFLHAKIMGAVELCAVYGQNVMNEGTARRCRILTKMDEQMFTLKYEAASHL
jgi:hypothetical protein